MTSTTEPATSRTNRLDVGLSKWQREALYRSDAYRWLFLIGGRGSGKSFLEKFLFWRWMTLCTELHWGIFGATDTVLHTILAPFIELLEHFRLDYCFESQAPQEWRDGWDRDGIKYPPRRLRSHKLLIVRTGAHFVTGSLVNNAYTRFKSFEFNGNYFGEGTEPGVTLDALTTLWGATRCGKARKGDDGVWRCMEPGHLHQLVLGGNEPLNDPSHWIYKKHDELTQQETARKEAGHRPFYRVIFSSTYDNPRTGEDFVDGLRAALDEDTFKSQTKPTLRRNVASLTYHKFSDDNILPLRTSTRFGLAYDPRRPLHIWFDFNPTPAVAGWGHDLRVRADEVPPLDVRPGRAYFGVIGELHSGAEPMSTDQVAHALLEDPSTDSRCSDCGCQLGEHFETGSGFICRRCSWRGPGGAYCSGRPIRFEESRKKFLHATPNWRGLIHHRSDIYVYGDASGGAASSTSHNADGNIKILRDIFGANLGERVHFRFKASNPSIALRELAVNRSLCAANGVHGVFFGDWCVEHIADGREVVPDPKTGVAKKVSVSPKARKAGGYWARTHSFDGFGYFIDYRWPAMGEGGNFLPMQSDMDFADTPLETHWPEPHRL